MFLLLGSLRCALFLQRLERLLLFLPLLIHAFAHTRGSRCVGWDIRPFRNRFSSLFFFVASSRCFFCCR